MPSDETLPPDSRAIGYVRISTRKQDRHSRPVQRAAIIDLAARWGVPLVGIEEDIQRGHVLGRAGYGRVLDAIRRDEANVVLVYVFSRWGRNGIEYLLRCQELDRRGAILLSVQHGRDQRGIMRYVHAGMAEQYSIDLAEQVRPAREASARKGNSMTHAPTGYRKVWPPPGPDDRQPCGLLEPNPASAPYIREMFRRYADGGWSLRTLAEWFNSDPGAPRPYRSAAWSTATIGDMLRKVVYKGYVSYNEHPKGFYERAAPGSMFVVPGVHEALVPEDLFEAVQKRLTAAGRLSSYNRARGPSGRPPLLGLGLLVCAECGARMKVYNNKKYQCGARRKGHGCRARGYNADLAHAALLAEVARLRHAPWAAQQERRGPDAAAMTAAARQAELDRGVVAERARLRRLIERFADDVDEPDPEEAAQYRLVRAEITARIRAFERERLQLAEAVVSEADAQDLHARLAALELPALVEAHRAAGRAGELRPLLLELIASARIVERLPAARSRWLRAEVTWAPVVQALLDAGSLALAPPAPTPHILTTRERKRLNTRRWREKQARSTAALADAGDKGGERASR